MELPPQRRIKHIIEVKPVSSPIKVRPYRYPHHHKTQIQILVQDLLKCGVITKNRSPYATPVVLVQNKDGSFRLCIDYRGLNKIPIKNKFPIPFIDEMLDEIHGARYFSKLDLRSGYYQIRFILEDVATTAFQTHKGQYEFKVMPFGITNSPTTFQMTMNELFHLLAQGKTQGSTLQQCRPRFQGDLYFVLRSIFDRLSKSQNRSNLTKNLPKLGQGTIGLQHSPVTHLESLWSD
jgi:hypothetical protein